MATGVLHRAPTPSLIGGAWAGAECAGPGTPNPNMKGQGHLSHETQPQPRSALPRPGGPRSGHAGAAGRLGWGSSPPRASGRACRSIPAGLWVSTPPWSQHPKSMGFELRRSLPHGKRHLASHLHSPMMKPAVKMAPAAVGRGVRWGGGAGGAGGATLHLVSPFCLNIMPRPD